ncbi:MAG TPA: hypothetical protein VGQ20_09080 [Acidimicrobiales bacterium]|nr:hypothetical protein [Acidimicrobiales bacterium]
MSGSPDFAGPPDEFLDYYTDHKSDIMVAAAFGVIAVLFLVWFLGSVSTMLRNAEGGDGRVAMIATIGGAIGAVSWLAGMCAWIMPALRIDEQGEVSSELATMFGDLSNILIGVAAPVGFGVLLLASAVLGFRVRAVPLWLAWVSLAAGLVMEIPWISFVGIFLFPLWALVVSIILLMRGGAFTRTTVATPEGRVGV